MLKRILPVLALLLCVVMGGCSRGKNNSSTSNNKVFNQRYKGQEKISPMGNVISKMQETALLEKNYRYYATQYEKEKYMYEKNRNYMKFLQKNDVKKIKNIAVETMPQENRSYLTRNDEDNLVRELNKVAYLEIEYVMFINNAIAEEQRNEKLGDPITHPYIYQKRPRNDRHIVMGDEYHRWHSWCEVNGKC